MNYSKSEDKTKVIHTGNYWRFIFIPSASVEQYCRMKTCQSQTQLLKQQELARDWQTHRSTSAQSTESVELDQGPVAPRLRRLFKTKSFAKYGMHACVMPIRQAVRVDLSSVRAIGSILLIWWHKKSAMPQAGNEGITLLTKNIVNDWYVDNTTTTSRQPICEIPCLHDVLLSVDAAFSSW